MVLFPMERDGQWAWLGFKNDEYDDDDDDSDVNYADEDDDSDDDDDDDAHDVIVTWF